MKRALPFVVSTAVFLSSFVAACAGPSAVVAQNPRMIELRWPNGTGGFGKAMLVAQNHCADYGRRVALESMFRDRDVSLATVQCR